MLVLNLRVTLGGVDMRVGIQNQSHFMWRKAPKLGYIDYLKSTSPTDRAQVITSKGEVLAKSPHYQAIKEAEAAYKSFYKIPSEIPDIKFKKKEEVIRKDQVNLSENYKKNNLYPLSNNIIDEPKVHEVFEIKKAHGVPEIKIQKAHEMTAAKNTKISSYKPVAVSQSGAKVDIYV